VEGGGGLDAGVEDGHFGGLVGVCGVRWDLEVELQVAS
jgi:hypothetical protein